MSAQTADVLSDPVGVIVDLVAGVEPGLDRTHITEVVAGMAGGRAKRRRLAQSLLTRPAVLTDGRSPAPEAAGKLLTALREAGAVNVSAPVCTTCGKPMRAFQRRGQDWYCGVHGPQTAACSVCGNVRPIAQRDRQHQPRCWQHPLSDDIDPIQVLIDVVASIDPSLDTPIVTAAIRTAAPQSGQRRRLAWALQDHPELLTGAGAQAPVPAVLRLIDMLAEHGSGRIVRPPCPGCGRVIALVKPRDGVRLCRNCVAKSRAQTCARCGVHREAATRDEQGRALCPKCLITDPANLEICLACRRRRPVSVRTPAGPLCPSCRPIAAVTCSICGRAAPGSISKLTGQACCHACLQRRARCSRCGNVRLVRSGTRTRPLCGSCTRPDADWHVCPGCGEHTQHRSRRCGRCTLHRRVGELLGDNAGQIRPQLQVLHDNLANHDRPETVLAWLNNHRTSQILGELAAGQRALTHGGLDELPDAKGLRHLRAVLVATGVLPARDEHLMRLERWITATIADRADPEQRGLLHRYALWHALHRLRRRNKGKHATNGQRVAVQRNIRSALDWLAVSGLDLTSATQGDLEQWQASTHATARVDAGNFVRWARRNKLTSLDFAAIKWDGPRRTIDSEARWVHARRLLHDDSIKAEDRVAGLLVLLYAQPTTTISRLTLDHVLADEHDVRLRLGHEPIVLPEPLDALVRELVASRHGHATLGDQGTSRWLFPGGRPGRPISAHRLGERLHQLGLRPGQARSTALFGLATELPAALLARLLGINISVAVVWQRASAGDWTDYAADYSRRNNQNTVAEGRQDDLP
ncbi:MAG TPA: hypothetical protein VFC57_03285 [Aeromicrobium sp.]|nr:hypothetical protein [Aeromicrobium sp.]